MVASTLSDSVEARDDCPELSGSHARDSMNVPATSHEPQIEVSGLVVSYGDTVAVNNISFTVERGENLTLLGPSGCGKTTTLRAIAGLEQPSSGLIRIDGKPMYSAAEGVNLATEKRGLSMVFQSYGVWPHMSVFDNVAYGLRVRKMDRASIDAKVNWALDLVHMREFAGRSAAKLSGGQQQRVAVARAIAFSPSVLLFDEPLSNLDAKLRAQMRVELRELQQRLDITSVYVTHDQEEALAISDRVIVMNMGGIEQIGTPEKIYNQPRSIFVADFVGSANLIEGYVRENLSAPGLVLFEADGGLRLRVSADHASVEKRCTVAIRTAYIELSTRPSHRTENCFSGSIRRRMFHGDFIQYLIDWPPGPLVVRRPPTEIFEEGAQIMISFAPQHCVLVKS
jgi:iron(III) transport system ATP-binding protein